jgi:AbrB family looped-hinge helix DNA binding protein
MSTATISPGGQLTIPLEFRQAMPLAEGDRVVLSLEDGKLIVQHEPDLRATLVPGSFGRPVLKAAQGALAMTPAQVKAILEEP